MDDIWVVMTSFGDVVTKDWTIPAPSILIPIAIPLIVFCSSIPIPIAIPAWNYFALHNSYELRFSTEGVRHVDLFYKVARENGKN